MTKLAQITFCFFLLFIVVSYSYGHSRIEIFKPPEQQLYEACAQGRIKEIELLLLFTFVYPNCENSYGQTPFWIACYNGQTEVVKYLLKDEIVLINKANYMKQTPLYVACEKGYVEIVKLLLNDDQIEVNQVNYDDQTPFWIACSYGHTEIVKLLLSDERVDINKENHLKNYGHYPSQKILFEITSGTPFVIACGNGYVEIVQYILASGREVNFSPKDKNGKPIIINEREYWGDEEERMYENHKNQDENSVINLARNQVEKIKYRERQWGNSRDQKQIEERKRKQIEIVELLESFERNPTETRTKLRNQLGLPGKCFHLF